GGGVDVERVLAGRQAPEREPEQHARGRLRQIDGADVLAGLVVQHGLGRLGRGGRCGERDRQHGDRARHCKIFQDGHRFASFGHRPGGHREKTVAGRRSSVARGSRGETAVSALTLNPASPATTEEPERKRHRILAPRRLPTDRAIVLAAIIVAAVVIARGPAAAIAGIVVAVAAPAAVRLLLALEAARAPPLALLRALPRARAVLLRRRLAL